MSAEVEEFSEAKLPAGKEAGGQDGMARENRSTEDLCV